jgi:hypothetical protein
MARELLFDVRMKALGLALALLFSTVSPLFAQGTEPPDGTKITSAQISGVDPDRISPGLRDDIGKLTGTPLNRQQLKDLAARIEAEQPRFVVGVRITEDSAGGARVVFVVARVREEGKDANINARYTVEDVTVKGIAEHTISQPVLDDLHALAGKPFDSEAAQKVADRLRDALPGYDVSRATTRGSKPGLIKLIYAVSRSESARFLRFEPIDGNALYHSDLGWGAVLPVFLGDRDFRVTPILTLDTLDDTVEEYSGFGVRIESRKLGTERLGLMFDWSAYDSKWRDHTLTALVFRPDVPGPYGSRMNFTPLLKFAFTRQLSIAGGVDVVELGSMVDHGPSRMANAVTGAIRYNQRWKTNSGVQSDAGAVVSFRGGTDALQSDFTYDRYFGQADYSADWGRQRVLLSAMGGQITGTAPLFERFTLGDSRTLRGWNKLDISPVGADRMWATSVEYRYRGLTTFFDAGSVWDQGLQKQVRTSAGFGYTNDSTFALVGFPLNTNDFRVVFMAGFRFGQPPSGVKKY